ncbi:MAG: IS1634 family transposase [Mesorhizobium sp.]|uniref:IS1634 family transposase n=1 Tax=Mesorhizobium sp. TaxID=1871066 RepID=UPI000FE7F693|nr:IS1634 family transposase [Mesorhizobium sp.]RWA78092.1 MAG: IS1634 family transposase [Mesorhizobium sp.]RWC24604.1 MAG: IS1634 family transposase [Mesorhizobium sp.]
MFVVEKVARGHRYLYLAESVREGGRVRQRLIRPLGRKDQLQASGELDRLVESLGRHCERSLILNDIDTGVLSAMRIGGPLLFSRLWERLGIAEVLGDLLKIRGFEFAVERAVFVSVLHRLFVSGSDRACENWMADYKIGGIEGLQLHHLYRAMAWLGEEIEEQAEGGLGPRCVKDLIEEQLFDRRRDLFTDLSLVFMDTTTLSFYGEGGESLGRHGHSKDYRPDLKQMVLAVVIDGQGRPICTEMVAGNTADLTVLLPIVDRLRDRFKVGRVCVVADRGMISAASIAALEARKLEYILGARERSSVIVRDLVMNDEQPFTPLLVERVKGETQLFVKQVKLSGQRYIVCRNEAEAEKDKADRQAIVEGLQKQLKKGDKALIGNKAYRRYLKSVTRDAFEIDLGKLAQEARYDGIFVLRTNARITPLQAVLRYRDLLQVEVLFRRAKALMRTRPIYHSSDEAIRGHVFCSFLALLLQKELADLCAAKGFSVEWGDLLRDLDRLQEATIEKDGKRITTRTHVKGQVGSVFQAAGVALPQNIREQAA